MTETDTPNPEPNPTHFRRSTRRIFLMAGLLALGVSLVLFGFTHLDLVIQDFFYRPDQGWLVDEKEPVGRLIFYTGAKWTVMVLGGLGLLIWLFIPFKHRIKKPMLVMLIGMLLIPCVLAGIRNNTNVYCPNDFLRYGGGREFAGFFDPPPPLLKGCCERPGKCFPAAHATAGFCWMAGFFVWVGRWRWIYLALGVGLGWTLGLYQMAKGAHFFSHTLVSMIGAWVLMAGLTLLVDPAPKATPQPE